MAVYTFEQVGIPLSVYKLVLAAKALHQSFWLDSGRPFGWSCEQIHLVPMSAGGQVWCLVSEFMGRGLKPESSWRDTVLSYKRQACKLNPQWQSREVYSREWTWILGLWVPSLHQGPLGQVMTASIVSSLETGPQDLAWSLGLQGPTWLWERPWVKSVETGLAFGM